MARVVHAFLRSRAITALPAKYENGYAAIHVIRKIKPDQLPPPRKAVMSEGVIKYAHAPC
jgi:hypothetical protein